MPGSAQVEYPASSIRDLVIHDDDVVVGNTGGRLDIGHHTATPVSDQVASSDAFLFKPQQAYRVRWNMNTDTPLPQEEPAGKNPSDGAIINYYLKQSASGPVTLEVFDSDGKLVRRFSSTDKPDSIEAIGKEVTSRPTGSSHPDPLGEAGMQRFVWDLHHPSPEGQRPEYPIAAIYADTPRHPLGPRVCQALSVRLSANDEALLSR